MGKKILVPCFDVYNDRSFPGKYTVKDHISNNKLEKGDYYYIQTLLHIITLQTIELDRGHGCLIFYRLFVKCKALLCFCLMQRRCPSR